MANRLHTRIPISLTGEIVSPEARYEALIENISEYGIRARIALNKRERKCRLGSNISLTLQIPYSEALNLNCKKRWSCRINPGSLVENVGIEVIKPPRQYREFYWSVMILLNA